jgi:hypothetical protein
VLELNRTLSTDPQLTKRRITQRMRERSPALIQDLLTVRNKQKAGLRQLPSEAVVVDRRHHSLSRAGGRDEQIAMMPLFARQLYLLQKPILERLKPNLRRRKYDELPV